MEKLIEALNETENQLNIDLQNTYDTLECMIIKHQINFVKTLKEKLK